MFEKSGAARLPLFEVAQAQFADADPLRGNDAVVQAVKHAAYLPLAALMYDAVVKGG